MSMILTSHIEAYRRLADRIVQMARSMRRPARVIDMEFYPRKRESQYAKLAPRPARVIPIKTPL